MEIRDAIREKCEELGLENENLKALVESHGDLDVNSLKILNQKLIKRIKEEVEILQTEVQSFQDSLEPMQEELERVSSP